MTPFTTISKKIAKHLSCNQNHNMNNKYPNSNSNPNHIDNRYISKNTTLGVPFIVSLYVQFAILPNPSNIQKRFMKENMLTKIFSRYGHVINTSIKSSNIDINTNEQCGYAFVHYENNEDGRIL